MLDSFFRPKYCCSPETGWAAKRVVCYSLGVNAMKRRTCCRIVSLVGVIGWLVTAAIFGIAQPWGLSFQGNTIVWIIVVALIPDGMLSFFSASAQFPPFGSWVLCVTTILVAAGGVSIYLMSIPNGCMGGMAIIVVPALQGFAVGAGLLLAAISKLIAYFMVRRGIHRSQRG